MRALMQALEQGARDFEADSAALALTGVVGGMIELCGCPLHEMVAELQVQAIERRN